MVRPLCSPGSAIHESFNPAPVRSQDPFASLVLVSVEVKNTDHVVLQTISKFLKTDRRRDEKSPVDNGPKQPLDSEADVGLMLWQRRPYVNGKCKNRRDRRGRACRRERARMGLPRGRRKKISPYVSGRAGQTRAPALGSRRRRPRSQVSLAQ